jgi:hypothetical protein
MKWFWSILVLIIVTGGCKKDPPVPLYPNTPYECANFSYGDNCNNGGLAVQYYDSTQFSAPSINPNNSDEFVYVYTNYNRPQLSGLYKYTISTGIKQKLASIGIIFQPKWGKNNWILFSVSNNDFREIYRIKSNGDSLKQITINQTDLFPEWDNSSNRIIFNRQIYLGSPASKIMIADFNGNLKDSINNQYFKFGTCNQNSELVFPPFANRECGITLINSLTKSENVLNQPGSGCLAKNVGVAWHPNDEDIYYTTYIGSLYKLNKVSKQLSVIKSFCDTKRYSFISISTDGNFMLVERIDGRIVNCNPWYKSTIYKVSINGKEEQLIKME